MKKKYLNIVLRETIPFNDILSKVGKAFKLSLKVKNQDGRFIAKGERDYIITLVDRYDNLGDFMCDENYILRIEVNYNDVIHYTDYEEKIKNILREGEIKWEKGTWRPTDFLGAIPREIYP